MASDAPGPTMPRRLKPDDTLGVALIGLGDVAQAHLRAWGRQSGLRVLGGADPSATAREATASRFGITTWADHHEMLAAIKPDLVCVLTPCSLHEAHTLDAAAAGAHVLCEKPLTLSLASAERMQQACDAAGVSLHYGAVYRHMPAVRRARELIQAGAIGEVLLVRELLVGGRGPETHQPLSPVHYPPGGPCGAGMGLVDHGIHLIDLIPWLLGSGIVAAQGRGNRVGEPAGVEWMHFQMASGAVGQLTYHDGTWPTELPNEGLFSAGEAWGLDAQIVPAGGWQRDAGCLHVHGTRGALRIFHYANALVLTTAEGQRLVPLEGEPPPAHFGAQMLAVLDAVRRGEPPPTPAAAGREALRWLLSLYGSGGAAG